jgi:hypothetical protein
MKRMRSTTDDSGSVSVFIVGCFLLALLLVATTTDLAVLQLDRRALQAQADGAALAAAQAPDLAAIYSSTLNTYVPIDPGLARRRAFALFRARSTRLAGFRVEAVTTDGRTVFVHLSARIKPPFLRLFGTSIRVDAQARATTAVG